MLDSALSAFSQATATDVAAFLIPFLLAIGIDLLLHRSDKPVSMKNAAIWSVVWVICSAIFGGYIYLTRGKEASSLYAMGYVLEKSLAIDNLFAFYLIFKSFGFTALERQHFQHRILYWGIVGAIVLRILFLGFGALIVNVSPYMLIAFAAVVLWTVWKMWSSGDDEDDEVDYTTHWSVRLVKRFLPTNPSIESGRFFSHGVTPIFLCLVCIETCDVVFAFDSMPVIIAVVRDPYLMITSSLWAAAGLRSLYFLLVAAQNLFWALDKAVMALLVFVSIKLIANGLGFHVPNLVSLIVVATTLSAGVLYSLAVKAPQSETQA